MSERNSPNKHKYQMYLTNIANTYHIENFSNTKNSLIETYTMHTHDVWDWGYVRNVFDKRKSQTHQTLYCLVNKFVLKLTLLM